MTPEQLIPDLGGWYRHRDTGRRFRLHMIADSWAFLTTEAGAMKPITMSAFIGKWIHDGTRGEA